MTQWYPKWESNGWRNAKGMSRTLTRHAGELTSGFLPTPGLPVANERLIKQVLALEQELMNARSSVSWRHVPRSETRWQICWPTEAATKQMRIRGMSSMGQYTPSAPMWRTTPTSSCKPKQAVTVARCRRKDLGESFTGDNTCHLVEKIVVAASFERKRKFGL